MLTMLLLLCVLVWIPLLLHQIVYQSFLVLLVWLFIAPVATNVIRNPRADWSNLFQTPAGAEARVQYTKLYGSRKATTIQTDDAVGMQTLFEPTRTLLIIFLLVFLTDVLLRKRQLGPFDRTEIWMGIYFSILLMSVVLKSDSFQYAMRITLDAFMVPFLTYFLVRRLVTNETQLRQFNQVMGYVAVYLIVIGFIERRAHQDTFYRLGGPFKEEAILSIVLAVSFLIVWLDFFCSKAFPGEKQAIPRGVRWFVVCLAPVIILLTWERGNWAGFLMSIWGFLLLGRRLIGISQKLLTIGLVLLLVPIIAVGVTAFMESIPSGRVDNIQNVHGRIATWEITLAEGFKHPIFGIGFFNMRRVLSKNIIRFESSRSFASVHNSFLQMFAELGVVGLFAYLMIVFSIIRMGLNLYRTGKHSRERWQGVTVIAVMLAYLVPSMTGHNLHIPNPMGSIFVFTFVGGIAGLYSRRRLVPTSYFLDTRQVVRGDMVHSLKQG